MVRPCKFYQTDSCKFGNKCKYDHVKEYETRRDPPRNQYNNPRDSGRDQGNPFGQPSRNPFDNAVHQPEPRGYNQPPRGGQIQGRGNDRRTPDHRAGPQDGRFFIDEEATRLELLNERPEWPLSCYTGAGTYKDTPRHLIGGELEQSPEEVRTAYYLAKVNGQEEQAKQNEVVAAQAANNEYQKVLANMKGAILYAVNGKKEPDSRWTVIDECNKQTPNQQRGIFAKDSRPSIQAVPTPGGAFGAPSGGFGAPSVPSQPSGFGQPSAPLRPSGFGAPSGPAQPSGFGQPSQLGQTSGFGRPSTPGGFGAPSAPSGFGQPSALGQTASAFGKPSALGAGTAFGQPSNLAQNSFATNRPQVPAFGAPTSIGQKPNPFGATSGPMAGATANPFGAPSGPAATNPFAQTVSPAAQSPQTIPFGQSSGAPQQTSSPFGQPSQPSSTPFGQQPSSTPFGQQPTQQSSPFSKPSNPFGQPSLAPVPSAGGFGQSSGAFGQPLGNGHQARGFGQPNQDQSNNVFGAPSSFQQQSNGFSNVNTVKPTTTSTSGLPSLNTTHTPTTAPTNLTMSPLDPNAPPRPEDPPEEMFGGKKGVFEDAYKHVREKGFFEGGVMPEVAPMHYWVGWGNEEKRFKT